MATLYAKTAGGNWSAAGTWSNVNAAGADNSGPPTAADNVIFELLSGNVTIDSGATRLCRSLDTTSGTGTYGGVLTHAAATILSIGDGTTGAGNVAIKLNSGMTYTLNNATTSEIDFVGSSATVQTVDFAGKTSGNIIYNSPTTGSWKLTGVHNTGTSTIVSVLKGTMDTDGQTVSWGRLTSLGAVTRAIKLGASSVTLTGGGFVNIIDFQTNGTGLTFTCGTSTITFTGANAQFNGQSHTFATVVFTGLSPNIFANFTTTIATLTKTGTTNPADNLVISSNNVVVTGTLNLNGNSLANRLLVRGSTTGTRTTVTITGATVNAQYVDFQDFGLSVSTNLSAITGLAGDCGNNSGITFTSAVPQYWFKNTGSWSNASKWFTSTGGSGTGRTPLPQDDVIFDANSFDTGSQTVTQDMPRMGKSVTWTGALNTPTWSTNTIAQSVFGGITLITGMNFTSGTTGTWNFEGRSNANLTMAGKSFAGTWSLGMPGATLLMLDAFTTTSNVNVNDGTLNTNGFSFTTLSFTSASNRARALILGNSTITISVQFTIGNAGGLTVTPNTSTLLLTSASSTNRSHNFGSKTWNNITFASGGTGIHTLADSSTYNVFTINSPKFVRFTAGTTTTVSSFIAVGSAGNIITIDTQTAGSAANLSKSSGLVSADYLSLKDSNATGGASWYAGSNSTNVSGNSGWIFSSPVVTENLSFTIVSTTTISDIQHYIDALAFTISSNVSLTDLQHYIDNLSFTITSSTVLSDLQTFTESLFFIINSTTSLSDFQTYLENLNFIINSTISITDLQDYLEALNFTINATITEIDNKKYIEALSFVINSLVTVTDLKTSVEALQIVINSDISITDKQHYIQDLLIHIIATIELLEVYHAIILDFKPISLRRKRIIDIAVPVQRYKKISARKLEPLHISLRRTKI